MEPLTPERKGYPQFTDTDFQALYTAFNDADYPRFIIAGERQRYWHTLLHFVSITALRRQALLGLTIGNVNFSEFFVTVTEDTDKKGKVRYKPITQELANDVLNLRRFYDYGLIPADQKDLVFPWIHGTKKWYEVWQAAECKVGKRFHLHDLKRFSGELALRAGASPLELQQHMDHANLSTTLLHYCRPTTRKLIQNIKVPLPDQRPALTPLFTDAELQSIVLETIAKRLSAAGIDLDAIALALDAYGEVDFKHFAKNQGTPEPAKREKPVLEQRILQERKKKDRAVDQGLRLFTMEGGAQ
jgi:hypothetical protein